MDAEEKAVESDNMKEQVWTYFNVVSICLCW